MSFKKKSFKKWKDTNNMVHMHVRSILHGMKCTSCNALTHIQYTSCKCILCVCVFVYNIVRKAHVHALCEQYHTMIYELKIKYNNSL